MPLPERYRQRGCDHDIIPGGAADKGQEQWPQPEAGDIVLAFRGIAAALAASFAPP